MALWSEAEVGFRPVAVADLPLLHEWLEREHVRAWWGAPGDLEQVTAEYRLRSRVATRPTSI